MEEHEKDPIQEIALFSFHHEESNLWMDQDSRVNAMKYCEEIMKQERDYVSCDVMIPDVGRLFQTCC